MTLIKCLPRGSGAPVEACPHRWISCRVILMKNAACLLITNGVFFILNTGWEEHLFCLVRRKLD